MKFSQASRAIAIASSDYLHKQSPIRMDMADLAQMQKDYPFAGALLKGLDPDSEPGNVGLANGLAATYVALTTEDAGWAEGAAGNYPNVEELDTLQTALEDPESTIIQLLGEHCPELAAAAGDPDNYYAQGFALGVGALLNYAWFNTEIDIFSEEFDEANPIQDAKVMPSDGLAVAEPAPTPVNTPAAEPSGPAPSSATLGELFSRNLGYETQVLVSTGGLSGINLTSLQETIQVIQAATGRASDELILKECDGYLCIAFPSN